MTKINLPKLYSWLNDESAPRILIEALNLYGTREVAGSGNNPTILAWANEVGGWIGRWYTQDSIPWCGLFLALIAKRAGFPFDQTALYARAWLNWGVRAEIPALGDVLVFERGATGGHVGLYVGEDSKAYHVLGGNQDDMVCIRRLAKHRLIEARRCKWKHGQPKNIRRIDLAASGALSKSEA